MSGSTGERATPESVDEVAAPEAEETAAAEAPQASAAAAGPEAPGDAAAPESTETSASDTVAEHDEPPAPDQPDAGRGADQAAAPEPTESSASETAGEQAEPEAGRKATSEPPASAAPAQPERPELRAIREAMDAHQPVEGTVIGWNSGGFHLAIGELSAFCPRSEMEIGDAGEPESYLDKSLLFRVLRLQGKGRRIVVSRAAQLRRESSRQRAELRKKLRPGAVLEGTVSSLTDFGAFVDLGGTQGLVHVSEISRRRVEKPSAVLSEDQQVRVKVLKVEKGGRRVSLSMRALEPDPWKELAGQFQRGSVVQGTVEKATSVGAFIELAPGLTGLLPARSMSIPRETTPARAYPPGKQVSVQIMSIDPRRQRISLALEGSTLEGSRHDYQEYQRQRRERGEGKGFNALASAFRRLDEDAD